MSTGNRTSRLDDRARNLVTLGWLLHVAGVMPLLVGLLAYYLAFRAPLVVTERNLSDRMATVSELLSHTSEYRAELKLAEAALERQQQRAVEVRDRIPDQPNDAEFLRSASEAAADSGLSIKDYSRGAVTRGTTFSQIDIRLECEGKYEDICRFLDRMEHIPRVARVMSMEITAESSDELYPLVLMIRLYFGVHEATIDLHQTTLTVPERTEPQRAVAIWPRNRHTARSHGGRRHG